MTSNQVKVGGEVEARCGRCKNVTMHVVIAMVAGAPKRVECLACHAVHNYRSPFAATSSRSAAPKSKKTVTPLSLDSENVKQYNPKGAFAPEDTIYHKKFGLGMVTNVTSTRLTVVFQDKSERIFVLVPH